VKRRFSTRAPSVPTTIPDVDARDLRHLAHLARLELDPDEVERLAKDLATVLARFAAIAQIDVSSVTDGEALRSTPALPEGVLREDTPRPGLSREDALRDAPDSQDGRFRTPRVPGGGS
jgi:aspartyl-tRNA(Asn)/glutamyl-tRNA(Gln) amidotransferase subunit C